MNITCVLCAYITVVGFNVNLGIKLDARYSIHNKRHPIYQYWIRPSTDTDTRFNTWFYKPELPTVGFWCTNSKKRTSVPGVSCNSGVWCIHECVPESWLWSSKVVHPSCLPACPALQLERRLWYAPVDTRLSPKKEPVAPSQSLLFRQQIQPGSRSALEWNICQNISPAC